jgi:hypothetical protein
MQRDVEVDRCGTRLESWLRWGRGPGTGTATLAGHFSTCWTGRIDGAGHPPHEKSFNATEPLARAISCHDEYFASHDAPDLLRRRPSPKAERHGRAVASWLAAHGWHPKADARQNTASIRASPGTASLQGSSSCALRVSSRPERGATPLLELPRADAGWLRPCASSRSWNQARQAMSQRYEVQDGCCGPALAELAHGDRT